MCLFLCCQIILGGGNVAAGDVKVVLISASSTLSTKPHFKNP